MLIYVNFFIEISNKLSKYYEQLEIMIFSYFFDINDDNNGYYLK
jgi:hypothetical protein